MAKTNPNAGQPNARNKKGKPKNKNANNAPTKRTLNSKAPVIQTAPAIKSIPPIKSTPIVKNSAVKYSPAIKSLAAIKSTPTKSNQKGNSPFGTPIKSRVIDLSTEDSDCEIQKVVTLSGQERKRRQELAAKEAAESPMRNKRIKIEISPSKSREHMELPRKPAKKSAPAKSKSAHNTPQTQVQHAGLKDHAASLEEVGEVAENAPASESKKKDKPAEKRKAEFSIDVDNDASQDETQVDEDAAANERKRKKKEKKARRKAQKMLEEEQARAQDDGIIEADNDEGSLEVNSTAPETNDFHQVRDVQGSETAHDTQQQAKASSTKKRKSKENKKDIEQTIGTPKSDGQFMQQLWGVLNGLETKPEAAPYAPSDSDCILDEQASTPRKGIRTVTRKVKIETLAANKPSPRFIRATTAPPPPTSPEASPSSNKSPLGVNSSSPARIEDDLALVRFHFEAIQNHLAALRYLSRTRNMRQEQLQEGFRRLVRSIPRLPPPLFGKKKGSYEEVESSVQHEGLAKE